MSEETHERSQPEQLKRTSKREDYMLMFLPLCSVSWVTGSAICSLCHLRCCITLCLTEKVERNATLTWLFTAKSFSIIWLFTYIQKMLHSIQCSKFPHFIYSVIQGDSKFTQPDTVQLSEARNEILLCLQHWSSLKTQSLWWTVRPSPRLIKLNDKAIPVTGTGGPQGYETKRHPHFLDGGEVVTA
jgi:hypothetical protein